MTRLSTSFTRIPAASWYNSDTVVKVFPLADAPLPPTAPWLFSRPEHLAIQTPDVIYSFILTYKDSGCILAVFHCCSGPDGWISPPCAPFGGIVPLQNCRESDLVFLLHCVRNWISEKQGQKLTIKTAPSSYDPISHELCHNSYLGAGFYPNHTYSSHYIPIGDLTFEQVIEPSERRRLFKGRKMGFKIDKETGRLSPELSLLLLKCYAEHDYRLSLPIERLMVLIHQFPEQLVVFSSWNTGTPIALLIAIQVNSEILYTFLSTYLKEYKIYSPALALFQAAHDHCRQQSMRILDLGVSMDHHGHEKPSLIRFKENIGGIACEKNTYGTIGQLL